MNYPYKFNPTAIQLSSRYSNFSQLKDKLKQFLKSKLMILSMYPILIMKRNADRKNPKLKKIG